MGFEDNGTPVLRRSALGGTYEDTPLVVPTRGHLDAVRRMLRGDLYIGRGCRQRGLARSRWCNDFKVSVHGRATAISKFSKKLQQDEALRADVWSLSGLRLLCHCTPVQDCHADIIIQEFVRQFPGAYDALNDVTDPPGSEVLNFMARLREEHEEEDTTSADEGVPKKGSGWQGRGEPMMVGTGHTARPLCDGQSLASPGRWPPECRRYPDCVAWKEVSKLLIDYSKKWGTADLLMKLALGRVEKCPFPEDSVLELKRKLVRKLEGTGHGLARTTDDRDDVLIDFRLLQALLAAAQDPEVSLGDFAVGVRVGPGARLPRLPALYDAKRRWRLPEQNDPLVYQEDKSATEGVWNQNYKSLLGWTEEVLAVLRVLRPLCCLWCSPCLAQDRRERCRDVGRIRILTQKPKNWTLVTTRRMVCQMDEGGCSEQDHQHGELRGGPWPRDVCGKRTGVRAAFLGTVVQVPVAASAGLSEEGPCLCLILPELSSQANRRMQTHLLLRGAPLVRQRSAG